MHNADADGIPIGRAGVGYPARRADSRFGSGNRLDLQRGPPVSCSRSDPLAAGVRYGAITVMVNVAASAAASVTNTASVSGGGAAAGATANDPTTINPAGAPVYHITKTHTGNFTQGQNGAVYTITVSNTGTAPTAEPYLVLDYLPAGLNFVSAQGTNWNCGQSLGNDPHAPPVQGQRQVIAAASHRTGAPTDHALAVLHQRHEHRGHLGRGCRDGFRQRPDYHPRAGMDHYQDSQRKLYTGTERRCLHNLGE